MSEAGYVINACNVTPKKVRYCMGIKKVLEVRAREVCPTYGSFRKDGTFSSSQGRWTCSHHRGVTR